MDAHFVVGHARAMEPTRPERHHLNVAGDFFVERDCCTLCGVPQVLAPQLFANDDRQCFVAKQPASSEELDLMVGVLAAQDLDCIYYEGSDEAVLAKLETVDDGRHCLRRSRLGFGVQRGNE